MSKRTSPKSAKPDPARAPALTAEVSAIAFTDALEAAATSRWGGDAAFGLESLAAWLIQTFGDLHDAEVSEQRDRDNFAETVRKNTP